MERRSAERSGEAELRALLRGAVGGQGRVLLNMVDVSEKDVKHKCTFYMFLYGDEKKFYVVDNCNQRTLTL